MWRRLYYDHYLLGTQKDTMPRRKCLRFMTSAFAASLLTKELKGQVSTKAIVATNEIEHGAPEPWEGSYPLFSGSVNLVTGNFFIKLPLITYSGRKPNITLTFFYNSGSASSLQPFGYGWTHSFNWKIQQDNQGNAILIRGTEENTFTLMTPTQGVSSPCWHLRRISPPSRRNLDFDL